MLRTTLLLACLAAATHAGDAQAQRFDALRADGNGVPALRRSVVLDVRGVPLRAALASVTRQAQLSLTVASDLPALGAAVTLRFEGTAAGALLALVEGRPLAVTVSMAGDIVIAPRAHPGFIAGRVLDATDGRPLAGAEITFADARETSAADGAFRVPWQAGAGPVRIARTGYHSAAVQVEPGAAHVVVRLEPAPTPLAEVVVTPGRFGALEETLAQRQTLTRAQIETAPQLGEDVFRAVTRLPGVASSDISAAFSIRGSRPREVLVMLDGLELYEPYHLKDFDGALSVLDVAAIGSVDLTTGGFTTQHGDRLAGVFDMRSSRQVAQARNELALSITALRGLTSGSFADGRGSWLASVRRGYLDLALSLGGGNENLSPSYWDAFGRVDWAFGSQRLSLHALHAADDLHFADATDDPVLDSRYGSTYAWASLAGPVAGALDHLTTVSAGRLTWLREGASGPSDRADPLSIHDDRDLEFAGVRSDWTWTPSARALTRFGVDVRTQSATFDYEGWRALPVLVDGDVVEVADTVVASLAPEATRLGVHVAQRIRVADPLTLEAGLRWDRMGDAAGVLQPRFNIAWVIDDATTLRAAAGRYAQSQGLHEIAVQDGDTARLEAERATQLVVGLERNVGSVDVRVEGYLRHIDDANPYWVNLDNTTDVFPEFTASRVRVDPGQGEARGLEVLASRNGVRWTWSASYALSEVTERIAGDVVPRARDQRHAFAADLAWSAGTDWRLSAAWQIHSGWPRTFTSVALNEEAWANGEVLLDTSFGPYNGARLPSYHRLDLRVTRHFRTTSGRVSVFLDLFNAYGRENPRALLPTVYVRNGTPSPFEEVETFLPRLPSLGIVWTF